MGRFSRHLLRLHAASAVVVVVVVVAVFVVFFVSLLFRARLVSSSSPRYFSRLACSFPLTSTWWQQRGLNRAASFCCCPTHASCYRTRRINQKYLNMSFLRVL